MAALPSYSIHPSDMKDDLSWLPGFSAPAID